MTNFNFAGMGIPAFLNAGAPLLLVVLVWILLWKGLGLWHACKRGHPWWFIIILIVNTVGILEIVYLFAILRLKWEELFKK